MATYSERIAYLRKEKGLTQEELGKAIKYSTKAIESWESGIRHPAKRAFQAMMNFFDVSEEYIKGNTFFRHVAVEKSEKAEWVDDIGTLEKNIDMVKCDLSPMAKYELFIYGRELIKKDNPALFAEKYAEKVSENLNFDDLGDEEEEPIF